MSCFHFYYENFKSRFFIIVIVKNKTLKSKLQLTNQVDHYLFRNSSDSRSKTAFEKDKKFIGETGIGGYKKKMQIQEFSLDKGTRKFLFSCGEFYATSGK